MRLFLPVTLLLISGVANAITIDLGSLPEGDIMTASFVVGDYRFEQTDFLAIPEYSQSTWGQYSGTLSWAEGYGSVVLTVSDGSLFNFHSVVLGPGNPGDPYTATMTIVGHLDDGSVVYSESLSTHTSIEFDSSWVNLSSVEFIVGTGAPFASLTNIVVSQVPIPAAAWLFGSALAGLGWLQRKQAT